MVGTENIPQQEGSYIEALWSEFNSREGGKRTHSQCCLLNSVCVFDIHVPLKDTPIDSK